MKDDDAIRPSSSVSQTFFILALLMIVGVFAYGYLVRPAPVTPIVPASPAPSLQKPQSNSAPAETVTPPPPVPSAQGLTEGQKRWLLACTAMLAVTNNQRHDTLPGYEMTADMQQRHRELLSKWWGIKNAAELRQTIAALEAGARSDGFKALAPRTPQISDPVYHYARKNPLDPNSRFLLRMREGRSAPNYLKSWDYCRAMNITRWGYVAGYFDEAEAWSILHRIGPKLQANYKSWEEKAVDYAVGFELFFKEGQRRDIVQKLLTAPNSPWLTIPWDLELSERKP